MLLGAAAPARAARPPAAGELSRPIAAASARSGVQAGPLTAICHLEGRFGDHGGRPSVDGGYGCMHLVRNSHADTLDRAAALLGVSAAEVRTDPATNIAGGAAVLRDLAGPAPAGHPRRLVRGGRAVQRRPDRRRRRDVRRRRLRPAAHRPHRRGADRRDDPAGPGGGAGRRPDRPPPSPRCRPGAPPVPASTTRPRSAASSRPATTATRRAPARTSRRTGRSTCRSRSSRSTTSRAPRPTRSTCSGTTPARSACTTWWTPTAPSTRRCGRRTSPTRTETSGTTSGASASSTPASTPPGTSGTTPPSTSARPSWSPACWPSTASRSTTRTSWATAPRRRRPSAPRPTTATDAAPLGGGGAETAANFDFFYLYTGPSTATARIPRKGAASDITDETDDVEPAVSYYALHHVTDPAGSGQELYQIWYGETASTRGYTATGTLAWLAVPPGTAVAGPGSVYASPLTYTVAGTLWYCLDFNHRQAWVPASEVTAVRTG